MAQDLNLKRVADMAASPTPDGDAEGEQRLTKRQSLQTIAVELHRGNLLKVQELALRQQELETQRALLEVIKTPQGGELMMKSLEMFSATMSPLLEILAARANQPPVVDSNPALPEPPAPHEIVHDGVRIVSQPGTTKEIKDPAES